MAMQVQLQCLCCARRVVNWLLYIPCQGAHMAIRVHPGASSPHCSVTPLYSLRLYCTALAAGLKGDTEEDQQLATTVQAGGGFAERGALCAAIRVRERHILARTQYMTKAQLRNLQQSRETSNNRRPLSWSM